MKVLVTGSSGLVGAALVRKLTAQGRTVVRLVRRTVRDPDTEIQWDPASGSLDPTTLEGLDAVVHLAGENIASRWTADKKQRIRDSRVNGTQLLCRALAGRSAKPKVLVAASAIGYYGDRGDEILREESPAGSGFLAGVCKDWEAATQPALEKGIRVVNLRIGVVLSGSGGALAKMLPAFKIGAGGVIGNGKQYMSWITLDDTVEVIACALDNESFSGPVNVVAPNPVTNSEFTRVLGQVLGRPTLLPAPPFALHLVFGDMAEEVLLASARVEPGKLLAAQYAFHYRELEGALKHVLGCG